MSEYLYEGHYIPLAKPRIGVSGKTGTWRTERPIFNPEKCIKCDLCWLYCPEGVISTGGRNSYVEIDYDYCKGCGICVDVCPTKALRLVPEG